jgi:hypothetical protein
VANSRNVSEQTANATRVSGYKLVIGRETIADGFTDAEEAKAYAEQNPQRPVFSNAPIEWRRGSRHPNAHQWRGWDGNDCWYIYNDLDEPEA